MIADEWLKSDAGELAHRRRVGFAMNTQDAVQMSIAWQEGVRAGWGACEQSKAVRISSQNEEPETCECKAFKKAQQLGTDNECHGPLFWAWEGAMQVGSDLPPPKYCPWCGKTLPPTTKVNYFDPR